MSANIYDFETGVIVDAELEKRVEQAQAEAEQEASDIAAMAKTPGWERFSKMLDTTVQELKTKLMFEEDPKKLVRMQEQAVAALHLIRAAEHFQEVHRQFQEERQRAQESPDGSRV